MIRFFCLLSLTILLPMASFAQPVQVSSGEHDGFTRLVLDYGSPVDWQVGRTTDGYELRLSGAAPAYDLTRVYDLIRRGRLASVWADPESGALRIGIGCACHAQPFEFRPGIVVIDLKDGAPPKGSSFELALSGDILPVLASRPNPRPRARPLQTERQTLLSNRVGSYDWTTAVLGPAPEAKPMAASPRASGAALPDADPSLQPLREALLHQLSRGAAQGVVEMAQLMKTDVAAPPTGPIRIRLNELPGVRIDDDAGPPTALTAQGASCIPDGRLDIGAWGTEEAVSIQMAQARAGLMGEFDAPDPAAQSTAVRFLLFIGFGAESRQMLSQFSTPQPDAAIFASLAHILDDSADPAPAFAGMTACDTSASLWAILGNPAPLPGQAFNRIAALRSFSGLPIHLRRLLGPTLVDRLLVLDDANAAEAVRNSILRAPGEAGPDVALMQARIDLQAGDPVKAELRLEPLITTSGPATPDALLAQVATHLARRAPLEPTHVTALEGLLHERRDSRDEARFALAVTRARALAGDFESAFSDLAEVPEAAQDVWSLLAEFGPDSALLTHAVLPDADLPSIPTAAAATLARRLSDLGFPKQARAWLRQVSAPDAHLAARIELQVDDARAALRLVAGSADPAMEMLRSEALYQLSDEAALADMLAKRGEEDARWRAVGRARDWSQLSQAAPAPWQPLATTAVGAVLQDPVPTGELAQGQALLISSAKTRQQIDDLLSTVPVPTPAKL